VLSVDQCEKAAKVLAYLPRCRVQTRPDLVVELVKLGLVVARAHIAENEVQKWRIPRIGLQSQKLLVAHCPLEHLKHLVGEPTAFDVDEANVGEGETKTGHAAVKRWVGPLNREEPFAVKNQDWLRGIKLEANEHGVETFGATSCTHDESGSKQIV